MEDGAFNEAGKFRNALVRLIGEFVIDPVLVNHLLSSRDIESLLENRGVVVRGGDVHNGTVICIVTFQTSHAHDLDSGGGDVGCVGSAVGAGVDGDGVVGGINCVDNHVFAVDLDDVTGLEDGRIGDGQGCGVGSDGRTLICGGTGRGIRIFKPLDFSRCRES